jgi:hypothetical protein
MSALSLVREATVLREAAVATEAVAAAARGRKWHTRSQRAAAEAATRSRSASALLAAGHTAALRRSLLHQVEACMTVVAAAVVVKGVDVMEMGEQVEIMVAVLVVTVTVTVTVMAVPLVPCLVSLQRRAAHRSMTARFMPRRGAR